MLTTTSPSLPAASRATRINSPCALCNAPIVGTSTRRFACGCACASAMVVRIFTAASFISICSCANVIGRSSRNLSSLRQMTFDGACAQIERRRIKENRIKTPVIISASIQTKSMLNHARRNIATPSFS